MFFKSKTSKFSFNILYSAFFILFLVPILYSTFLILDSNKPDSLTREPTNSLTRELVNPLIINVAYALEPTQAQLDQTASILNSIKNIINKLKIEIQSLFSKEVKAQADITTGLVGYWKFDEGVGTTAADSAVTNTGTLTNGPIWTMGKIGGALSFDGLDDYVAIPTAIVANYPFTLCAWFKSNSATAEQKIISIGNSANDTNVWDLTSAGHVAGDPVRLDSRSGSTVTAVTTSGYTAGNWHFACGVGISATNREVYIDAGGKGINTTVSSPVGFNTTAIGRRARLTPENYFSGSIDEVRIYNRALTQAEITELYNYAGGAPPLTDTTPPVLSSGSPTGALPSGTTQTTLSVEVTDASSPVSCKYSQTPGIAYPSITETLSTVNGTTFTATITGLTNGTSYNYYVRCSDASGNANTIDYTISFSVSAPAGDTTPPTISITSPTNGATVSGTITITANATDNVGVAGVQFKLDNSNLGTEDTTSPYSYSLNTTTITDGSHTLLAVARDTSNNYATSSTITITVNNASPPPSDITLPSIPTGLIATAISSSQINLSWTASTDDVGVTGYKIYRCAGSVCTPTVQIATSTTNSYSNTGLTASTAYTYAISAYDAAGNESGKSTLVSATTQTQLGNTYYVDDDVPNDTGNGSITNPKKYITSAIQLMKGGDTLIIKDGVYTGANNMIGDYASPQVWPPSGLGPNQYTVIKAENIGRTIIDGEYLRMPFSTWNSWYRFPKINYVHIEGIHFRRGECGVFNIKGDYNKIIRSGFEDGQSPTSTGECAIAWIADESSHSLVEDSWIWGRGRIGLFSAYTSRGGTDHTIFRRVVVRLDDTPPNWVSAGILFYGADTNVCQNCLVIDSTPDPASNNTGAFETVKYAANTSWYGSIALNNINWWGFYPQNTSQTTTVENIVFWKNGVYGWGVAANSGGTFNVNHVTLGSNGNTGFQNWGGIPTTENISNSISVNNANYGFAYIDSINTVNVYGNTNGACSNCAITNGITTNPFTPASGYSSPALKYLPRIEANSNLKGAATDGGDIGATILKKIGVSGTLYGEPGWDQETSESLWPYPDEDIWTPKLRAYNASGTGGNRGFAVAGNDQFGKPLSLTRYIWQYLGNQIPCEIYSECGGVPDIQAPTTPISLSATAVSSSQINLSWTASTDPPNGGQAISGVTGYKIYRCAGTGCAPTVQIATSTTNSYSNTGLTASTVYTYAVSAYDSSGNESAKSSAISATTLTTMPQDTTLPTISLTSPTSGATVSGIITVAASASDNVAVAGVQFKLDGANLGIEDITSPYSLSYDTTQTTNGSHTLLAIARDSSNNRATSSALTITVNNDLTPPQISSVISTTLASTTARIDWTTNEPSTSQVEYGFTTQYGASTTLDSTLLTSHSVSLSNLSPDNTLYHFRVRSKDSSNNESISINYTFITPGLTDTTPPASTTNLQASNITQTSVDLVTWTAAGDDGNQGTAFQFDIRYATAELSENTWNNTEVIRATGEPTPRPAGSVMNYTLLGLTPNTTYKTALKTLDEILNQSLISNIITFTTLKAETAQTTPQTTTSPSTTFSSSGSTSSSSGGGGGGSSSGGGGGGGSYILSDTTPPPQITDLESQGADKQTRLTWNNPESTDWVRTIIVRKEWTSMSSSSTSSLTTTHATSTKDGTIIYEGTDKEFTDTKLKNNQTYYYSIFTIDRTPNYSSPATTTVKTIEGKMTSEIEKKESFFAKATKDKPIQTPTFTIKKGFFKRILKQGMKGKDVKKLQEMLYQDKEELYEECGKEIQNAKIKMENDNVKLKIKDKNKTKCTEQELITGYFGPITKLALIRFQEKYKEDILTPNKLKKGTGILGKTTIKKIEEMYAQNPKSEILNSKQITKGQTEKEDKQKAAPEQQVKELKTQLQELIKQLMGKIKEEMGEGG